MIKIIDLGCEIPETGEARVTLVDESLIKTASNDIQEYWTKLERDPNKAYLHVIAMTDSTKYGPNNNGDFFYGDDLRKYHDTFKSNAHVFLHHVNKDPKKSMGKPIYTFYNENMHRVELILEIDKTIPMAKDTITKIQNGEDIFVSMGVRVAYDQCSICGNKAKTRKEYCDHLRYNMKKILPDGRQVYSINPAPLKFFDISVVRKPADRVAWALEKAAAERSFTNEETPIHLAADLGADYEMEKLAREGLQKFSEIIKYVDGDITKVKDNDENVKDSANLEVIKSLKDQKIRHLDYPEMSFDDMEKVNLSPGGLLRGIGGCTVAPSLGELAYASGKHHMGEGFKEHHMNHMFKMLPAILQMLSHQPRRIFSEAEPIMNNFSEDFDSPEISIRIKKHVQPTAAKRIMFMKSAGLQETLEKTAAVAASHILNTGAHNIASHVNSGAGFLDQLNLMNMNDRSSHGPGVLEQYSISGSDGKEYTTNTAAIRAAKATNNVPHGAKNLIGATVGLASLGALLGSSYAAEQAIGLPGLLLAAKILLSKPEMLRTQQGVEIPANTAFTEARDSLTKTANVMDTGKKITNNLWPTLAMTAPSALGLDYLYNKHIKYRNDPMAEQMMSPANRLLHKGGKFVTDHPALTIGTTGVLGAAFGTHLKR